MLSSEELLIRFLLSKGGEGWNVLKLFLADAHKDRFLATALTAQAAGLQFEIEIDDWKAEGNVI